MDIRPTSEQAANYLWFGRQCLDLARRTGLPGAKAIQDGRLLVICKYTRHHATLITISQGDFAMHPRSGKIKRFSLSSADATITAPGVNHGGYTPSNDGFKDLSGSAAYPLVDNDHGTFLVMIDGEEVTVEWAEADEENYGNIWWTSAGDNPTTLSWRGPPSVQFPLPSSYSIPGLTQDDGTGGSTVFGCYIYHGGTRIHGPQWSPDDELATLVVGACYAADRDGRTWLVALCITRRDSGYWFQVWRSKNDGTDWQLLRELSASGPARVPAFISPDGRAFVYDGVRYVLDDAVSSVGLDGGEMPTTIVGLRTITGAGGYGSSYEFSGGVGYCWPGMSSDDEFVYSTYTETASFGGTGSGDVQNEIVQVPVYRGNPAKGVTIRAGYGNGFVFDAEASGSYCSIQWSGVDGYKDTHAWKAAPKGCNTDFSVSVTLLPQGVSDTYEHTSESEDMTVSGPETLSVGAQYVANHAIAPITWSISQGTISDAGMVTSLPTCQTSVTITAVDVCGRTSSMSANRDLESLVISGPQTDVTQGQYGVSGAAGGVSWSVTQGSISDTGYAVFSGCGSASVTATDSCGRSASLSVKLPSGKWCLVQYDSGMQDFSNSNYSYSTCISGGTTVEETWVYHGYSTNEGCTAVCYNRPSGTNLTCYDGISRPYTSCGLDKNACAYVNNRRVYVWMCSSVTQTGSQTTALPVGTRVVYTWS